MSNSNDNGIEFANEVYKTKVENFRFYLTHMIKMLIMYLSVVGAVVKFGLDKNASQELFFVLLPFGCIFCFYAEYVRRIHVEAINRLDSSLKKIMETFSFEEHTEDCENFSKFVFSLQFFNYAILGSFVFLIIYRIITLLSTAVK